MNQRTKSRGNGEGSIFKSGSRWRAVLTIGQKPDGKPIRKTRTARTRGDAAVALEDLKRDNGFRVSAPTRSMRVNQFLSEWLATMKRSLRPGTYDLYELSVRVHINPHLGGMRLSDLSPANIDRWVQAMSGTGARARQQAFAIFKRALKRAVRLQLISANPMDGFDAPAAPRKQIQPFSSEEAKLILTHFRGDYWYPVVTLALRTGMRQGELFGLQWGDIDGDLIHIRRQMTEKGGEAPLKTEASRRSVPISEDLVEMLSRELRFAFKAGRAKKGDLIFQGPRGGRLKRSNFLRRWWKPALEDLGIEYRGPHHMRHTFATHALNSGVPITVVSKILGHSKVSTTLDVYSHVLSDDIDKARDAVRRLFA